MPPRLFGGKCHYVTFPGDPTLLPSESLTLPSMVTTGWILHISSSSYLLAKLSAEQGNRLVESDPTVRPWLHGRWGETSFLAPT